MATAGQNERDRKAEAVDLICTGLAAGKRPHEIRRELSAYDVHERTIERWMAEAAGRVGADALTAKFRNRCRAEVLAGYLHIIETAIAQGELAVAKAAYDSVCKMLGLNAPAQLEVQHRSDKRSLRDEDEESLRERLNLLRTNGGERAH